jgi:secretion/DNA translocation related CpaE-like protein
VVSGQPALVDELQRLAAAAGTPLLVTASPEEARGLWGAAPIVLVGPDALPGLAQRRPDRRDQVFVVAAGAVGDAVFPDALAIGAHSVVELPAAETWLVETLTDCADGARGRTPTVGVVGGSGGAGATTFAAALAQAVARAATPVTLVDVDPVGAGIERVVGLEDASRAGWGTLSQAAGRLGSRSLRAALPQRDGLAVLGWGDGPRPELEAGPVREALSAAQRGSSLVVADLPRHPTAGSAELTVRCDAVVVVTGLDVAAVAATAQVVGRLVATVPAVHLVARGPASGLDPEEVAELLGVSLAAVMGDQRRLAESVELGLGPLPRRRGPLWRAVRSTLAGLERSTPWSEVAA